MRFLSRWFPSAITYLDFSIIQLDFGFLHEPRPVNSESSSTFPKISLNILNIGGFYMSGVSQRCFVRQATETQQLSHFVHFDP